MAASNHGEELQNHNSDDSPTQISNQAANGDDSTGRDMDADVYKAAAMGDMAFLFEKISEFQVQLSPKHNTILHIASEFGQAYCVYLMLRLTLCSSLLQVPNLKGDTPLHLAAREGHWEVVNVLLEAARKLHIETGVGVDREMLLTMTNKGKNTALHEAVRFNHSDVVKLLIEEEPRFTYRANDSGTTPLYMAAERGFTGLVKLIIDQSRTSPSYNGLMGRTVLHAAVICNAVEMTMMILEWKPNLTKEVDENGWSPLHYAADRGCDLEIVELLLKNSEKSVAYLRSKDGNKTALHIASFHHHTKIVEKILSHSPGCREQVDDEGNNVFHFALMKKGDDDFNPSNYFDNRWLSVRGLINEKNVQGNTPIHQLSLNQISDFFFIFMHKVDKKEYNNEDLTAYDIILKAKEDISGKKDQILEQLECAMHETESKRWEKMRERERKRRESLTPYNTILWAGEKDIIKQFMDEKESKEDKEKRTSALREQGKNHLIVSALITTITFSAGFTLPGGYKDDDGKTILSKKAAFIIFVVMDTIAMVSSLYAVFLHFFMTMRHQEEYLAKHLVWAFILTMIGMGAMVIAFASGMYVVLPHSSALSFVTCMLCSSFFLSFILEYSQNWRGTISDMFGLTRKTSWLGEKIFSLFFACSFQGPCQFNKQMSAHVDEGS
ncbi:protein ACCELERATED CELL DEATH 6-like [Vitis riparia]|uniref:protein ACCELERATED CELL DEATH 6-like n=1 Tax=Vitis riparia TaxID=96939 RepID=UPI00155A8A8B|nr:protein ACCELERATED CELL DEATH 6-like [Vitis riparia]